MRWLVLVIVGLFVVPMLIAAGVFSLFGLAVREGLGHSRERDLIEAGAV